MKRLMGSLVVSVLAGSWIPSMALGQQLQEYEPITKVAPVYPASALADGLEGHVVVQYTITEEGTVVDATVVESSDATFNAAAVEAVSKFKYTPRVLNSKPVAVPRVNVRVLFKLPVEH